MRRDGNARSAGSTGLIANDAASRQEATANRAGESNGQGDMGRETSAPPTSALDPLPNSATTSAERGGADRATGRAARTVYREIAIPAGTLLRLRLEDAVGSDRSRVEDGVRARLANPVVVGGRTAIPAGSVATGHVTTARRSGRVKGRGYLAMRFTSLTPANEHERYDIRTNVWAREARATKKKDAAKIAIPAGAGALVGGILGGKKGAAIGAGVGGGAGTGVVLTTRGQEIRLSPGATIVVRLSSPLTVKAMAP
jgi:hypothetical protein